MKLWLINSLKLYKKITKRFTETHTTTSMYNNKIEVLKHNGTIHHLIY